MTQIHKRTWTTTKGKQKEAYRVPFQVKGERRFRQFKTKSAATAFLTRLGPTIDEMEQEPGPLIKEVAEDWLRACRVGRDGELPLEPYTIKQYKAYLDNHVIPFFPDREITKLTRLDCRKFRDALLLKGLARNTTKKIFGALKGVCMQALNDEIIKSDPTHRIVIRVGGRHKKDIDIPSKEEMAKLIAKARALSQGKSELRREQWTRYSLMLELAVYCGLRMSEVRGLPRTGLDFANGTVSVTQRADQFGRIGSPKSVRSRRTLYMPDELAKRLAVWVRTHNHDLVFPTEEGNPILHTNVRRRMWIRLLKICGLPIYNLHATRHFFASRLIEGGANPKELSNALGHADEGFTLSVYGHLFTDAESERRRKHRANSMLLTE